MCWIMQSRGRTARTTKLACRTTVAAAGAVGVATPAVATRAVAGGAGVATRAAATAATASGDAAGAGTMAAAGAARVPTRSRSPCTARSSPRSTTEATSIHMPIRIYTWTTTLIANNKHVVRPCPYIGPILRRQQKFGFDLNNAIKMHICIYVVCTSS